MPVTMTIFRSHGGPIIRHPSGGLTAEEDCCCPPIFVSCAECIAGLQGLALSINGYANATDSLGGSCLYAAINGNYGLTIPVSTGTFKISLAGELNCITNTTDRGIQWYHRTTGGTTLDFYAYEIEAGVTCAPGTLLSLTSLHIRSWSVRQPATGSCTTGLAAFPTIEPVSSVLGFTQTQPEWTDFCGNNAQACWHRTPNGHPSYNFNTCDGTPMDVDACVSGIF